MVFPSWLRPRLLVLVLVLAHLACWKAGPSGATPWRAPEQPVISAPSIVLAGQTFTAQVTAVPGVSYAWVIGNGEISGASSLPAVTCKAGTAGTPLILTCRAWNYGGSAQGTRTVTVQSPTPQNPSLAPPSSLVLGHGVQTLETQDQLGCTYQWDLSGATLVAGQGTPRLTFLPDLLGASSQALRARAARTALIGGDQGQVSVTVTVTNSTSGQSTANTVTIPETSILDVPPDSLAYAPNPAVLVKGAAALIAGTCSGGTATTFTVAPALPAGLTLDPVTGLITGSPIGVSPSTSYGITAANGAGSTTATLVLAVNDAAPSNLEYQPNPAVYAVGEAVQDAPSSAGGAVSQYRVAPALPSGLSLDPVTGILSGVPQVATPAALYRITASNPSGETSTQVSLAVLGTSSGAPVNLEYESDPSRYGVGSSIAPNHPRHGGGAVDSYSVAPRLPEGLELDPATGVISGTPTAEAPGADYTVTAHGALGDASATLRIQVVPQAPVLTAQPQSQAVALGRSATFSVAVAGPATCQWFVNGIAIPGATALTYSTPATVLTDSGKAFRAVLGNAGGTVTSQAAVLTVTPLPVAPSVLTQPASQTVQVGQSATFSVGALGTAPLGYQWRRGGVPLPGAGASSYTTPPVAAADSGASYDVVISNAAGSVTSAAAILTVTVAAVPPTVVLQPVNQSVDEGQSASFTVAATGSAPLGYQWRRDAQDMPGATAPTFTLAPATLADSGASFDCRIVNAAGSVLSAAARLTVTPVSIAPTITSQPASLNVLVGQTATFIVGAAGTAPLAYQWSKDGVPLPGEVAATLALPAAQPSDAGTYSVRVSNPVGSATSAGATLAVTASAVAPSISTQPADLTVAPGHPASFTVVAAGTGPFTYQWRKDGAPLQGATAASYAITSASAADAGAYGVTVTNSVGSVSSVAALLTVTPAPLPPAIATQPQSQVVTSGDPVTFTVQVTGTAPFTYQWTRNNVVLAGETSATLSIAAASAADAGSYGVTVSNSVGNVSSAAAVLTVNAAPLPPAIATQPQSQVVTAGDPVSFTVQVTGTAPFTYQWTKDSATLPGETSATLSIAAASAADAGSYAVTVGNIAGTATSQIATLGVNPALVPPSLTSQPQDVSVTEGQSASFTVTAQGSAPLAYQWFRGGTPIAGATSTTFTLAATALADDGATFSVQVANAAGSVTSATAGLRVAAQGPVTILTASAMELIPDLGISRSTLSYTFTGTGTLDQGVGPVTSGGTTLVQPTTTTTYTLTTSGGQRAQVTVQVDRMAVKDRVLVSRRSDRNLGEILDYKVSDTDQTGTFRSALPVGGSPARMASDAQGRIVATQEPQGFNIYLVDRVTGALTRSATQVLDIYSSMGLAVRPDGSRLYHYWQGTDGVSQMTTYALDPDAGTTQWLSDVVVSSNYQTVGGDLLLFPSDAWILAAEVNYSATNVKAIRLDTNGDPAGSSDVTLTGVGPLDQASQTTLAVDRREERIFLFLSDSARTTHLVATLQMNGITGVMTPAQASTWFPVGGRTFDCPRRLVASPTLDLMYAADGDVTPWAFSIDRSTGAFSPFPAIFGAGGGAMAVTVSSDGQAMATLLELPGNLARAIVIGPLSADGTAGRGVLSADSQPYDSSNNGPNDLTDIIFLPRRVPKPYEPPITAPAFVRSTDTATATVVDTQGATYQWSLSTGGKILGASNGTTVTIALDPLALGLSPSQQGADLQGNQAVTLSCIVTPPGGSPSTGIAVVVFQGAPKTPAISLDQPLKQGVKYVTMNNRFKVLAAQAPDAGTQYRWLVNGGVLFVSATDPQAFSSVTSAASEVYVQPTTGGVGGTLTIQAFAVDGFGRLSALSSSDSAQILAPPVAQLTASTSSATWGTSATVSYSVQNGQGTLNLVSGGATLLNDPVGASGSDVRTVKAPLSYTLTATNLADTTATSTLTIAVTIPEPDLFVSPAPLLKGKAGSVTPVFYNDNATGNSITQTVDNVSTTVATDVVSGQTYPITVPTDTPTGNATYTLVTTDPAGNPKTASLMVDVLTAVPSRYLLAGNALPGASLPQVEFKRFVIGQDGVFLAPSTDPVLGNGSFEDYTRIPAIDHLTASLDGSRIAYAGKTKTNDYTYWHIGLQDVTGNAYFNSPSGKTYYKRSVVAPNACALDVHGANLFVLCANDILLYGAGAADPATPVQDVPLGNAFGTGGGALLLHPSGRYLVFTGRNAVTQKVRVGVLDWDPAARRLANLRMFDLDVLFPVSATIPNPALEQAAWDRTGENLLLWNWVGLSADTLSVTTRRFSIGSGMFDPLPTATAQLQVSGANGPDMGPISFQPDARTFYVPWAYNLNDSTSATYGFASYQAPNYMAVLTLGANGTTLSETRRFSLADLLPNADATWSKANVSAGNFGTTAGPTFNPYRILLGSDGSFMVGPPTYQHNVVSNSNTYVPLATQTLGQLNAAGVLRSIYLNYDATTANSGLYRPTGVILCDLVN